MESLHPSRIFSAYRAAGFVSNHVPLVLQVKGSEHFVTTAVGKTFHIYNVSMYLFKKRGTSANLETDASR